MWAVFQRNIRAVECLIKNKCDLTIKTKNMNCTAIDFAILSGNYLMSYYLYM